MVRGHFYEDNTSQAWQNVQTIYSGLTDRHKQHIMTNERKIKVIHQMLTGRRKVIILLTPGILCLMADQTVTLEITHPQT